MRQVARLTAVLAGCSALGIGFVAAAQAVPRDDKVQICHATASDTNPYVLITVDVHALAGHFRPDGETAPGHGKNNFPDVIPADGVCPGDGTTPS